MLFCLSIRRRRWYYLFYARHIRSRRFTFFLFIILFICVVIISQKKKSCWLDFYRSRLFCFVLTTQGNLENRSRAVYETWGHRCGRFVLVTRLNSSMNYTIYDNENELNGKLPLQYIPTLPDESYSHLPDKVRSSFLFFHKHYPNYDWYLKADDDTYVIVENLLKFLVTTIKRYPRPLLYGYRFREDHYVSGGGGYVLTREGLELLSSYINNNATYSLCNSSMEDLMIGQCLQRVLQFSSNDKTKDLTIAGETIDDKGRERFHPLAFRIHFNGPTNKSKREWIHFRPFHHNLFGYEALSETTISFHYTEPEDMYQIDSLLYNIRQFDKQVCLKHLEQK